MLFYRVANTLSSCLSARLRSIGQNVWSLHSYSHSYSFNSNSIANPNPNPFGPYNLASCLFCSALSDRYWRALESSAAQRRRLSQSHSPLTAYPLPLLLSSWSHLSLMAPAPSSILMPLWATFCVACPLSVVGSRSIVSARVYAIYYMLYGVSCVEQQNVRRRKTNDRRQTGIKNAKEGNNNGRR